MQYTYEERGRKSYRAHEADNWRFQITLDLDYRQILDNSLLDMVQASKQSDGMSESSMKLSNAWENVNTCP